MKIGRSGVELLKAATEQERQNVYHSSSFTNSGQILPLKKTASAVIEFRVRGLAM